MLLTNLVENYQDLPVLEIGNRMGRTGYIDFLQAKDLNANIMRGQDCFGRKFVSFLLELENGARLVETFFERYQGDDQTLARGIYTADRGYEHYLFWDSRFHHKEEEEEVQRRIQKIRKEGKLDGFVLAHEKNTYT